MAKLLERTGFDVVAAAFITSRRLQILRLSAPP